MSKIEKFTHNGKTFEVRVVMETNGFCVSVFHNSTLISPKYCMTFETGFGFQQQKNQTGIGQLIAIAKSDIKDEMYYPS
ncbi:MAG: hypothetical protein JKY25_09785 [Robiginitomaculum sp.]|nr:hypothetical protein [Robiginitomaculum sp.]